MMNKSFKSAGFYLLTVLLTLGLMLEVEIMKAQGIAQQTTIVVRAQSKDAKFIGSSMGGALVTIRKESTGEVLASGIAKGSTGDTELLMRTPRSRHQQISTPGAAKFETTLELKQPVFVTVTATAPLAQKQSQVSSSTQLWLIPGKDITGDGIILEIPGFAVDVLEPRAHQSLATGEIPVRANIVMMCGCPTSDGGLWDSSEYEIRAIITQGEKELANVPLSFSGETSLYEGSFNAQQPGAYEITVYAYHQKTGNTGVDKTTVTVSGS